MEILFLEVMEGRAVSEKGSLLLLRGIYYLGNGLTARIYRYFFDSLNRLVTMRGLIPERKDMPAFFSTFITEYEIMFFM